MLNTNLWVYSNLDEVPFVHINSVPALRGEELSHMVNEHVCLAIEVHHYLQHTLGDSTVRQTHGPAPTIVIILSWEENIFPAQLSFSFGNIHLLDTAAVHGLLHVQVDAHHQVIR